MTRDDIIRMAQEAGLYHFYDSEGHCTGITDARLVTQDKDRWDDRLVEMLAPFANLVAAAELRRLAKVEAQRDALLEALKSTRAFIHSVAPHGGLRRLHAQRDQLLEALRALVQNEGLDPYSYLDKGIGTATAAGQRWLNARAAIKKAEGEKT